MGTRTSHAPGTLSWIDLTTTDPAAAQAFYTDLFGWVTEDGDTGDGGVYTTARVEGSAVAGMFGPPPEGAPAAWTSYVTVVDADAAAARVAELGGAVLAPPFDVMDAGRMAVLTDPQGAVFAVWEPRGSIGAERVNDIGCLCMNELATTDLDAAGEFYGALFGWTTEVVDTGPDGPPMQSVLNEGRLNATFSIVTDAPSHWRPYFTVESVAATTERVQGLGGQVLFTAPIPDGSIALVLDPQGAVFGLFEGEVDP